MITPLALAALLTASASAAPDAIGPDLQAWAAALGSPGARATPAAAIAAPASTPAPIPAPQTQTLNLSGLVDRHWTRADSFTDAAGKTSVSATLDLQQKGWLVVVPPGAAARLVKMEAGMSDRWTAKGQTYSVGLAPNLLSQYDSVMSITNETTGAVVWQRSVAALLTLANKAGQPATIGGRGYRVFLSHLPAGTASPASASKSLVLGFVYDSGSGSDRYQFFLFSVDTLKQGPLHLRLLGGASVYARLAPDLSTLELGR